ncbi:MAG: hypothetical protein AAF141_15605 [Pseudomonadota bacterium]
MEVAIVQKARGNPIAYLQALKEHLPAAFAARAEILDVSARGGTDLPRLIARISDVEDADFDLVSKAMENVGDPGFDLTAGGLPRTPLLAAPTEPELAGDIPTDLAWMSTPLKVAKPADDVLAMIEQVFNLKESGIDFPELHYEGHDKKAYDDIVKTLKISPMEDQGERLTIADIRNIARPKAPKRKKEAWAKVLDHLENEVRYYSYAKDWFGDAGHLRNLYRDQVIFDHYFMDTVNDRFDLVPQKSEVVFYLDTAMKLLVTASEKVGGPEGKVLGKMMGLLWDYTVSQTGDPTGKIQGKIDEIRIGVDEAFTASVRRVEKIHVALCGDWGNLQTFAQHYETGALTWPKDASDIRKAHAMGFHYEALRVLLAIKSRLETKNTGYTDLTWGIVSNAVKTKSDRKRKWDASKFKLYSASSKSCGKKYYYEIFLGTQTCPLPPSRPPPPCNAAIPLKSGVPKKLFGTNTDDEMDPQLGISPRLLDSKKWRKDHGWVLAPYF